MGRGAMIDISNIETVENGKFRYQIDGETKWSVISALVDNAISMRTETEKWGFGDDINKAELSFVTLFEACEQLQLDMELYSEECGVGFEEHFIFIDGELIIDECVDIVEKYNDETMEYERYGGFGDWDFEI